MRAKDYIVGLVNFSLLQKHQNYGDTNLTVYLSDVIYTNDMFLKIQELNKTKKLKEK